jgi:hypothetical protein
MGDISYELINKNGREREMRRNWLWASLECTAIKPDDEVDASASPKLYCFNSKGK